MWIEYQNHRVSHIYDLVFNTYVTVKNLYGTSGRRNFRDSYVEREGKGEEWMSRGNGVVDASV